MQREELGKMGFSLCSLIVSIMKKQFYWLSVLGVSLCLGACGDSEETAVIKVNAETLMHEVRATSVPFD